MLEQALLSAGRNNCMANRMEGKMSRSSDIGDRSGEDVCVWGGLCSVGNWGGGFNWGNDCISFGAEHFSCPFVNWEHKQ